MSRNDYDRDEFIDIKCDPSQELFCNRNDVETILSTVVHTLGVDARLGDLFLEYVVRGRRISVTVYPMPDDPETLCLDLRCRPELLGAATLIRDKLVNAGFEMFTDTLGTQDGQS